MPLLASAASTARPLASGLSTAAPLATGLSTAAPLASGLSTAAPLASGLSTATPLAPGPWTAARAALEKPRFSNTTVTRRAPPVVDVTVAVTVAAPTCASYALAPVPAAPYAAAAAGCLSAPLEAPDGAFNVLSCSDGSLYPVVAGGAANDACSDVWTTTDTGVVAADGFGRLLHYYNGSAAAYGVSRLRAHAADDLPASSVVVVLAPYRGPAAAATGAFYVAVDANGRAWYLIACSYAGSSLTKIFLAAGLDEGIHTLMSPAVEATVTGGPVDKCGPLHLAPRR